VHSILLKNEILIVEHLCNLEQIPSHEVIKFSATPPKIKGMGTFSVRAFVEILD
jgi:arylformamidase